MKRLEKERSFTVLVVIFVTLLLIVLGGCNGTTDIIPEEDDPVITYDAPTFSKDAKSWGFILTINSELNYDVQMKPTDGAWSVIYSGTGSTSSYNFEYTWTDHTGSAKIPKNVDVRIVASDDQTSVIRTINHQMITIEEADLSSSDWHRETIWVDEHAGVASAAWVKVYALSGTTYSNAIMTEEFGNVLDLEGSHLTLYNDAGSLVVDRWSSEYIVDDDSGTGNFSHLAYGLVDTDVAGYYYLLIETDNLSLDPNFKTCDTEDYGYIYAEFSTPVN